jgi:hypothetical protein
MKVEIPKVCEGCFYFHKGKCCHSASKYRGMLPPIDAVCDNKKLLKSENIDID